MSLPNYLANIKSSGIYRFTYDKSQIPAQTAETLRLLVGYSEKGPFNTPVYIESMSDFINVFGNISKRLERRGVYFHRMALQALASGPILALNIKPFSEESVMAASFDASELSINGISDDLLESYKVNELYDTNKFWKLDADAIPNPSNKYINICTTDSKENSCTIFMRPWRPTNYSLTLREWFNGKTEDPAPYLDDLLDVNMRNFFAEIYVFKGEMTEEIRSTVLADYFKGETLNAEYVNVYGENADVLEALSNDPNSNFLGRYRGCTLPYFKDMNGDYISLDVVFNEDYNRHKCLMKLDENMLDETSNLIIELTLEMNGETITTAYSDSSFNTKLMFTQIPESLFEFSNGSVPKLALKPTYLKGYKYETVDKTFKDTILQNLLFDFLKSEKGIRSALTNRVDAEYHYLVDTFQSYIDGMESKAVLTSIAKEKDNAFAIINFPPMQSFVDNAKYKNEFGKFDISKIADNYKLVSEVNGASYCGYFTQVVISDGTVKTVIPSAALVSNNFMEKWSSRQPYYIVAGPIHGVLSWEGLIGPDYNFSRNDLDHLEPMGVNAIVYVPRKGTYINSNQTAKQNPVSALSKIHVRELVIYLQNEIASMLENYHWELNTQTLRDTIKAKADAILETVKNNGGVYEYVNICDNTNNSPAIIDNEMLILDTHIEPARGAGKMIHKLTLYRTGEMSSYIS